MLLRTSTSAGAGGAGEARDCASPAASASAPRCQAGEFALVVRHAPDEKGSVVRAFARGPEDIRRKSGLPHGFFFFA